jgi:hypothetical protein
MGNVRPSKIGFLSSPLFLISFEICFDDDDVIMVIFFSYLVAVSACSFYP